MMNRTLGNLSMYDRKNQRVHNPINPIEKKKRDLAQQIAATFPEINVDISFSSFRQPKMNQILDHMIMIFGQSIFTLPDSYASTKEDIFHAISKLMENFMKYLLPVQVLPSLILVKTDSTEFNFKQIQALFNYMCKLKTLHDNVKDHITRFNQYNYTKIQHIATVYASQPVLQAKIVKLTAENTKLTRQQNEMLAKGNEMEDSNNDKLDKIAQLIDSNTQLTHWYFQK